MGEEPKSPFYALESMRNHAWSEFQEKARIEWRLSFGIWAGLLAGTGAVLSAEHLRRTDWLLYLTALAVFVVFVVHARFLLWVQGRLARSREFLREAQSRMQDLLDLKTKSGGNRRPNWMQPSLQVQLAVTLLAGSMLLLVVYAVPTC